ncbi:7-methylxanthine methyltransferase 1-like [Coffea arabica]|uniref:7-methylxanthine methyltransferase 1-like n=1 Tax=Coffea arabica TaxID=13443 RepID=A0ABM4UR80_COFAR
MNGMVSEVMIHRHSISIQCAVKYDPIWVNCTGLIEEKALDTFNLPHYRPSLEEVKTIIEKNRALKIRYLDTIQLRVIGAEATDCGKGYVFNTNTNAKYRARSLRAIYEPIFQAHSGDGIMNDFFTKLAANISQHQGMMKSPINSLVLSLSRT